LRTFLVKLFDKLLIDGNNWHLQVGFRSVRCWSFKSKEMMIEKWKFVIVFGLFFVTVVDVSWSGKFLKRILIKIANVAFEMNFL
jgi:hypothetical protein